MTDQQWQYVWEIYRAASELPDDERPSYLALINADPEVVEEVRVLLEEQAPQPLRGPNVKAGTRVGRYEVAAKLGRGGMGEVWEARDTELDRRVALKFLAVAPDVGRAGERLTREARAASALNHPNIVTVYEVIQVEQTPVLVMELVEGTALRALIGTPQSIEWVVQIGRQIAHALAAAHAVRRLPRLRPS